MLAPGPEMAADLISREKSMAKKKKIGTSVGGTTVLTNIKPSDAKLDLVPLDNYSIEL